MYGSVIFKFKKGNVVNICFTKLSQKTRSHTIKAVIKHCQVCILCTSGEDPKHTWVPAAAVLICRSQERTWDDAKLHFLTLEDHLFSRVVVSVLSLTLNL